MRWPATAPTRATGDSKERVTRAIPVLGGVDKFRSATAGGQSRQREEAR